MADFTTTITNSFNLFGGSPSSLWNSWNWGEFNWGEGTADSILGVTKLISNSQSIDDTYHLKSVKVVANSLLPTTAVPEQYLLDGNGYYYLFVRPTIDAENRSTAAWTDISIGDVATWACQAAASTTWTDL